MKKSSKATAFALMAAALYAINIPLSKIFLNYASPTIMVALLYLGAGFGVLIYSEVEKLLGINRPYESLTKKELPYTIGMIVLDVLAPIFLMFGISYTNSANVSLLNNFEIVVTALLALIIFKEHISKRLWFAIILVTIGSAILSFEGDGAFVFNKGSLLVLAAASCWGLENNCTRMISNKSSSEIVIIKGIFSGTASLIISFLIGESLPSILWIIGGLFLGFVAYGLSINLYIMAQKDLGAAKTSAYYSVAPFLGVAFSLIILGEVPTAKFYIALIIMTISTVLMVKDNIKLQHTHDHFHIHNHTHSHGSYEHSHEHSHKHSHIHIHEDKNQGHYHSHKDLEDHNHSHEFQS